MNAFEKTLKLEEYVVAHRQEMELSTKGRLQMRQELESVVGFKPSDQMLKAVLEKLGIHKLTKEERAVKALQDEVQALRDVLVKFATAVHIPDWLRDEVINQQVINEEVKEVLRKKRTA